MERKITVGEARRLKNVTQEKVAKQLGLSLNAYRSKEAGNSKFYIDEAFAFCEMMGMDISEIFFGDTVAKK